jgi:uncharacterized protein
MTGFVRTRPILSFVVLAFGITYGIGLPWFYLTEPIERSLRLPEELISLAFMRAGPTLAGLLVIVLVAGRSGIRIWLRRLFHWRVHPGYYALLAAIVVGAFAATNFVIFRAQDVLASSDLATDRDWGAIAWSYAKEIAYITVTNGEETGWRFALMGLLLSQMRLLPTVIITGGIWALWHMPAFFMFGQAVLWYPLIPICLAYSVIYGWLYQATGSLFIVVLAHGAANATYHTFEQHFTELSSRWDAIEPLGDWAFAGVSVIVAMLVITFRGRLFFGATPETTSSGTVAIMTKGALWPG